jgi:ribose transport system permease protein
LTAIIALGVFFVILTGGIDLSVGSTVGVSGFLCGLAMASGLHPLLAVIVGLLTGAAVGAVNGAIVAFVGVTPFIVTLGMLGVARGVVLVIKHGDSVREISKPFIEIGNGSVLGISVPVIILIVLAVMAHVVLKYTAFGRRVYAVGGNEEATALSGINTRKVKFFTYVICGALAAVTGILFVARFQSAQADAGKGMELDAIAATVIGGTSLMGGEGSVVGVLIGAMIMGVIRNGLVLMEVSSYWQELIIGSIIVLAAILDIVRSRRRR